jgi:uncharacterized protein
MTKVELGRELSEADYDQLARMLSLVVGGKIANVEALDRFLTALVINPDLIKPSEFVPLIISGSTEEGDLIFDSTSEAEQFYGILMRYWNQIRACHQLSQTVAAARWIAARKFRAVLS